MGQHEEGIETLKLEDSNSNNGIYKAIYITFGILLCLTIISTFTLTLPHTSATVELSDTSSATASVNVNAACTLSASGEDSHITTLSGGQYDGNVGTTTVKSICNDSGGYALYAIGYSNDSYIPTELGSNTDLIWNSSTAGSTSNNIATGTATSGNTSAWSMKLAAIGTPGQPYTPIIAGSSTDPERQTGDTDYSAYATVPSTFTKVAYYPSSTMNPSDPTTHDTGSSLTTTYGIYVSPTQAPGTYTGAVKYTLVHPSTEQANLNLYDTVARMSKGKQNAEDLRKEIVTPTQETPVSTNSGVYEYNADEFGVASDANNNYPIYYYRGVLDTYEGLGTYGSDGMADAYPNYVKLGNNTCWRIVRTTGSGGVKMIYNGIYGATTSGSCRNSVGGAAIGYMMFGVKGNSVQSDWVRNINRVGYTFNNAPEIADSTEETSADIVFGDNSNYTTINSTNSNVKDYIENIWYTNNMTGYTSRLEASAGYCNDRSAYIDDVNNTVLQTLRPYSAKGMIANNMYFGSVGRNMNTLASGKAPSFNCPRGAVDSYSTNFALDGNRQLIYPAALLTADEASMSGSGHGEADYFNWDGFSYNFYSFLNFGGSNSFWLLSPSFRDNGGTSFMHFLPGGGKLGFYVGPNHQFWVRPVVSLVHGTTIASGSGTAEDPWTIAE